MKLRLIDNNGLFVPQFLKKGYYGSSSWTGFGHPNIKFTNKEHALQFIQLVDKSVATTSASKHPVIFQNFKDEVKRVKK